MHDKIISSLMSNPTIGITLTDAKGCFQQANATFCNLTGYDEAELKELSFAELFHSNDREEEAQTLRSLLESNENHFSVRKRYLGKAGKVFWGDTHITLIRAADGSCEAMISMVSDATEMRRQEILQQGQSRILEQLYQDHSLEDICDSIVATIETLEEGLFCSILKLNETNHTLHKLAAPSLPDFYNDAIEGMKIGTDVGSCGAAAYHKKRVIVEEILGHPNWKRARRLIEKTALRSCWSQPIFSHEGRVLGTFAMYYETPRKPTTSELQMISAAADMAALAFSHKKAIAALKQSNDLKSELISTAAHELRTPLGSIMGYAELMRFAQEPDNSIPGSKEDFLEIIMQKTEMLSRIIGDLFDLSKAENGYCIELQKKPVAILSTLTTLIDHYRRTSPKHTFNIKTLNDLPEEIPVDEDRIIQVLDNLISNAVKYSPDGGPVDLVASAEHNQLQLSITDHGIGMSEEQLEHVFDKFYRAQDAASSAKGLGLGMSIAKEIVEAHGGKIQVQSTKGQGTQVQFTVSHN